MLDKTMRRLFRYSEIASVLTRHGFGYLFFGSSQNYPSSGKTGNNFNSIGSGRHIREALEELGPTFIKIGQLASVQSNIIPAEICHELEKLQDKVNPIPFEDVRRIIEYEMNSRLDDIFVEFNRIPMASASIGQVHYAKLKTGESVIVKVQRPNIESIVETDLEILHDLVGIIENHVNLGKKYPIRSMFEEFSRSLRDELDYRIEGRNAERLRAKAKSRIIIPSVFWGFSTKRMLTLEFINGVKINQMGIRKNEDGKRIAKTLSESLLKQILVDGFFHGDPHPGNILIVQKEKIAFVDFGIIGQLDSIKRQQLAALVVSLGRRNTKGITRAMLKMGDSPVSINKSALQHDIEKLKEKHLQAPLSQISLGESINDFFNLMFAYNIKIKRDFILVGKSLLTLEGIVENLDSEINIVDLAKPFGRKLLRERYSLSYIIEKTKKRRKK